MTPNQEKFFDALKTGMPPDREVNQQYDEDIEFLVYWFKAHRTTSVEFFFDGSIILGLCDYLNGEASQAYDVTQEPVEKVIQVITNFQSGGYPEWPAFPSQDK